MGLNIFWIVAIILCVLSITNLAFSTEGIVKGDCFDMYGSKINGLNCDVHKIYSPVEVNPNFMFIIIIIITVLGFIFNLYKLRRG